MVDCNNGQFCQFCDSTRDRGVGFVFVMGRRIMSVSMEGQFLMYINKHQQLFY